ncbi:21438_t:CDS:2 [Dentiscutata erythropus]|uniref:21438_t:CDS:1 n=1 Tax=Dentiscutata erythropus TaxID=1348616 RepID=A0A9N9HST0_9GLOM|nr:21438_t:CDS:2 [Dentiscutata erythropus]
MRSPISSSVTGIRSYSGIIQKANSIAKYFFLSTNDTENNVNLSPIA